ncbi:MAG: thiolase family protein [Candidatus Tectomicrobia bacterium]|uniref:propanoyl-CoA C-acyltransferase n=1 Tax=Tectimicrobiota bacterium TaxID=2528274 RepID=A0A937VZR4_UNCTE|nr:thiolase family protein [Candidatus Tectomicrobia bacterium]
MSETLSAFHPRPVYVAASYLSRVGKYNGTHLDALTFVDLAEQVGQIFHDSTVRREHIEAVIVGSQNPFAFNHMDNVAAKITGLLGISGAKSVLIDTASSSGASAFENAYLEVASGRYDRVLTIGIQKMTDVSTEDATRIIAGVIDREEAEYGLTMPACGALVAKSLMHEYKLDEKEWTELAAQWAARAHRFAAQCPHAHLNFPLPIERYMADCDNGRNWLYYDPLRLYDCCPMSDAVAACILTAEPQAVQAVGVGAATDLPTVADRGQFGSFPATVMAARYAYGMAGITNIRDMAHKLYVNMHDPFSSFGPVNLADLGLVEHKAALRALLDDDITGPEGRFPTNLSGGLLSRGHPLGATGMVQVAENHLLLLNTPTYQMALAHSIGGPINNNVVTLLEKTDHYVSRQEPKPFKPTKLPKLAEPKPKGLSLETLFAENQRVKARFHCATTRFNKDGEPLNSIVLLQAVIGRKHYEFLIGTGPGQYERIQHMHPGQEIRLGKHNNGLTIDEVPVQRLYRKTMEGIVEIADSAWHLFVRRKQRMPGGQ